MVAASIFMLLFFTLFSARLKKPGMTIALFLISLVAIILLFLHHATDALGINL
jgi:hypothetical protein